MTDPRAAQRAEQMREAEREAEQAARVQGCTCAARASAKVNGDVLRVEVAHEDECPLADGGWVRVR
jgi:hypothetical protein